MKNKNSEQQIARNVTVHDRIARKYEALHGEIFNDLEQARLRLALKSASDAVRTETKPLRSLDFGCGSGNLTRHLLALGLHVTAADVSPGFLALVRDRYRAVRLDTLLMNGTDLSNVPSETFDLIASYSVLHHIPDYLAAVRELCRVCQPGGVIMLDHEPTEDFWKVDPVYRKFRKRALRFDWRKYLTPSNYIHRLRRVFESRYSNEGDIHVWPDDHIEWSKISELMKRNGFEVVLEEKYLLYRKLYRREVYEHFKDRCVDTKMMIFRKIAA